MNSPFSRASKRILHAARSRVDKFQLEILKVLREELDLLACSLYSLIPHTNSLSLRGQAGLSYDAYDSFLLNANSAAGKCLTSKTIEYFDELSERNDYTNKNLIERFSLDRVVTVPIHFSTPNSERAVCSLCMYPKPGSEIEGIITLASDLQQIIELALHSSLDFTSHELRAQLVERAVFASSDISSFLYRMLRMLQEDWNFEAGSVFLFDSRAMCLRLAATTGLNLSGTPKRNIFYRLTETEHQTVQAFVDERPMIIGQTHLNEHAPKYREKLAAPFHSGLVYPFDAPSKSRQNAKAHPRASCLGILRLVNRQILHSGAADAAEFTWEDIEVVKFLCDMLGVVTHLYQRVAQKGAEFERVVHGLETSILTALGKLHNINDNVDASKFPSFLQHSIPDNIAFVESIHEQIRVFKLRDIDAFDSVNMTTIKLYSDIIMKLRDFATKTAHFFAVDKVVINRGGFFEPSARVGALRGEQIRQVPRIYTDSQHLLSVFKNLVENAIKYSRDDTRCYIKFGWQADDDFVEVYVSDSGIGVPEEDEEFIFNEGYQAENAMRRRTMGTGIGLYQCRLIMEKLGGSVSYRREPKNREGLVTTFIVRIPRERPEQT